MWCGNEGGGGRRQGGGFIQHTTHTAHSHTHTFFLSTTSEGILEHYWGEHIHLGYYTPSEREAGYLKKDFKKAKIDFVDAMLSFAAPSRPPRRILDVGCGIGGTSRLLAAKFPEASVQGITLSSAQVMRATQLAAAQGLENVAFRVMDALNIEYEEGTFDLVWVSCGHGGGGGRVLGGRRQGRSARQSEWQRWRLPPPPNTPRPTPSPPPLSHPSPPSRPANQVSTCPTNSATWSR